MAILMQRRKQPGDGPKLHTPTEVVKLTYADGVATAVVRTSNARRILDRHGFMVVRDLGSDAGDAPGAVVGVEYPVLNASIGALKKELAAGKHDDGLDRLRECEVNARNRKGALEAIDKRAVELAG